MNLCMEFCMELVRILYGYLFRGLEYLFLCRILVWNGFLVWLWSSIEENFCIEKMLGFRGNVILFFKPMFFFFIITWPSLIQIE